MNMIKVDLLKATRAIGMKSHGLISFQIEVPLYIWTEILTHRRFARNASSARAMSTERYVNMGYYTPEYFYTQGKGMQSSNDRIKHQWLAVQVWHTTMKICQFSTKILERLSVAKEQRNRLIPPTKIVRAIVTGTEDAWKAFLLLRNHHTADKAMQDFARLIEYQISQISYYRSTTIIASGEFPQHLQQYSIPSGSAYVLNCTPELIDNWTYADIHLPFEGDTESIVAQIARVSYARTKGKDDKALYDALWRDGHLSPFEHIAYWTSDPKASCFTTKDSEYADIVNSRNEYEGFKAWESLRSRLENSPIDKQDEA